MSGATYFRRRRTIHVPVTLSVLLMVLNVILMVTWIVILAGRAYLFAMILGTVLFTLILIGLVVYLIVAIKEVRLNQRQANFVDSVTHELKSPIASLKLYLETLQLRTVDQEQQARFYQYMMDDLNRLDRLINQLLEVGRLDAIATEAAAEDVAVEPLLRECAIAACLHHDRPLSQVRFDLQPASIRGGRLALEMIFRNLLDNALKYGGAEPDVEVQVRVIGKNKVVTRISDSGPGVHPEIRNKVFGLFYRGGSELEREHSGTGLGLYIVHSLVRRMKGRISIHSRGREPGAVFKVELPGRAEQCVS